MVSNHRRLGVGGALRLGLRQALSLPEASLGLWLARALSEGAGALGAWALLAWLVTGRGALAGSALFGLALLWSAGWLLRGLLAAAALRQGASRLRGGQGPGLGRALLGNSGRGLGFVLWYALLEALVAAWGWLALISTGWLYLRALALGEGGAVGAAALALALVLGLPLGFLASLWARLALVDAVEHARPYTVSLFEAVRWLRRDLLRPALLLLLTGVLGWVLALAVSLPFVSLTPADALASPQALRLALAVPLATALLAAFPAALLEHAGWQGLLVLGLEDEGALPPAPTPLPPPGPEPVVQAEPILEATLVRPPEGGTA